MAVEFCRENFGHGNAVAVATFVTLLFWVRVNVGTERFRRLGAENFRTIFGSL